MNRRHRHRLAHHQRRLLAPRHVIAVGVLELDAEIDVSVIRRRRVAQIGAIQLAGAEMAEVVAEAGEGLALRGDRGAKCYGAVPEVDTAPRYFPAAPTT